MTITWHSLTVVNPVTEHNLTLAGLGLVRIRVYDEPGAGHIAVVIHGTPTDGTLVRVQSSCLYGEVLGSLDCDCHAQLHAAMSAMATAGAGVLIHLQQEGRGAGLGVKAAGYALTQTTGVDTFQAYEALGVPEDGRTYDAAAEALKSLGLSRISLLTNNPAKIASLEAAGLQVNRLPLVVDAPGAMSYLSAKRRRGHLL